MLFIMDESLMEYTSKCCRACNLQATNHQHIKSMLFGIGIPKSKKDGLRPFNSIPMSNSLPMGMRLMHDAYVFIYLMATCIATLMRTISQQASPEPTQTKVRQSRYRPA